MEKHSLRDRFRYWFDNRMAGGSIRLIRFLLIFTILFVMLSSGIIILFRFNGDQEPSGVFWDSISTIINAWMPSYEDGPLGYLIVMGLTAFAGLLFTSVLIGIITSAMEEKIVSLRKGNSIVIEEGHTVVLGFYPGEYTLVRQLILAAGDKPGVIVIGAEMERDELQDYIRDNIEVPKNIKIVCRTVDLFDPKSIEKLAIRSCRTILISPTDDRTTVKALLAVSALINSSETRNIRVNAIIAKNEYRFPETIARKHNVTTLQTYNTLAKIIAHSCTQTGLSDVFREVFNFEGSELYYIQLPGTAGMTFRELMYRLDACVPIGIYRDHEIMMNPEPDAVIEEGDKLLVFAEERESAVLLEEGKVFEMDLDHLEAKPEKDARVLIIGWNETLKTVLEELPENVSAVTMAYCNDSEEEYIRKLCLNMEMEVQFEYCDLSEEKKMLNLVRRTEHVILLSDHDKEEEEADMDTIFLLLNLRDLRNRYHLGYNITAEMRREANQSLVVSDDYTDFIVASNMASLFLAQLAESPELKNTFREILSNEGNELFMKRAKNLHCTGEFTVSELRQIAYAQGYIFLGYMTAGARHVFNPPLDQKVILNKSDSLIVLGES